MNQIKYTKISNSRGKKFCDELWTTLVKLKAGNKCIICGLEKRPNAHHLISRRIYKYRWNVDNGVSICPGHHEFKLNFSFHTSPWTAEEWLKNNKPEQYAQWVKNRNDFNSIEEDFDDEGVKIKKNPIKTDWDKNYYELEKQYKELTGDYFRAERINGYLLSLKFEEIKKMTDEKTPLSVMATKCGVSVNVLKDFLKKNKLLKIYEVKKK